MGKYRLDKVDRQILSILQQDGRIANNKLAEKIGLTTTPTLERVKRLEKEGIIKGYSAQVNANAVGRGLVVFCSVKLTVHQMQALNDICEEINKLPEIQACYHLTGEVDFLLKIMVEDMRDYEQFMHEKLTRLPGIQRINSNIVLSTKKENYHIPVKEVEEDE